jgi:hypothetical protein
MLMMLSTQQFDRARRLALSLAGIELVERHREVCTTEAGDSEFLTAPGWIPRFLQPRRVMRRLRSNFSVC